MAWKQEEKTEEWEAGVFDFQWTGGGLGVVDLAYFFISAALPEAYEKEEELLRLYYDDWVERVRQKEASIGGGCGRKLMGWTEFLELYEVAFCDFMRWLVGYGMWGGPAEAWSLKKVNRLMSKWDGGKVLESTEYSANILSA